MKQIFYGVLLFAFCLSPVSAVTTCEAKIVLTAAELVTSVADAQKLIKEMKEYDKELDKAITELDAIAQSTIREYTLLSETSYAYGRYSIANWSLAEESKNIIRSRLNYNKALTSLLEFYYKDSIARALKKEGL